MASTIEVTYMLMPGTKNKCPDCGKPIYRTSKRCSSCHMKIRHKRRLGL